MRCKELLLVATLLLNSVVLVLGQATSLPRPAELEVLKSSIGVWDAKIEVWPEGLDSASVQFTGVETNRAYGEYWIASDFDSTYMGEVVKVHSIVGYDLTAKKLVGTVVDHGPYSAKMTGEYDSATKSVTWTTKAKMPNGDPIVQKTVVKQTAPDERVLVLSVPKPDSDQFTKFMVIQFSKRQ